MRQPKHAAEPIPERLVPTLRRGPYSATPAGKKLLKSFEKKADDAELEKGRRLARRGIMQRYQIRPGMITAEMEGEGGTTIRVAVRTSLVSADFTRAFVDKVASRSGFSGAFLNRELPKPLLGEIGEEKLVPAAADLAVSCSACPETQTCRHGIAAKCLFVDLLNEDALLLPLWRGIGTYPEDELGDWPADTEPIVDLLRELRGWTRPARTREAADAEWNRLGKVGKLPDAPEPEDTAIVEQLGLPSFFPDSERNLMATLKRLQEDA